MGIGSSGFPIPLGDGSEAVNTSPLTLQQAIAAETFGADLYFDDPIVTAAGDYLQIQGIANFRQSILHRLMTNPGEYRVNPDYGVGLPSYVKKKMTTALVDEIKNRIIDNVSRDRRTDSIVSLSLVPTFFGDQTGLQVNLVVKAKGNDIRFAPFNFTQNGAVQ